MLNIMLISELTSHFSPSFVHAVMEHTVRCVMLCVVCVAGGVSGVFPGPADPGLVHVAGLPHESDRHEWPLAGRALTGETLGLTRNAVHLPSRHLGPLPLPWLTLVVQRTGSFFPFIVQLSAAAEFVSLN